MRTWKCRCPGSTPRRAASSRLVSASSSPFVPSVSRMRSLRGWPSAFSCSGLSSRRTSIIPGGSGGATVVLYIRLRSVLAQYRGRSRVRDDAGPAARRPDEARGRVGARRAAERATDGAGLRVAGRDEQHFRGRAEHRQRHRHAVDERLELRLGRDCPALTLVERRLARKERGDVAVGPDPEQDEVEARAGQRLVVLRRCCLRAELAADPVCRTRLRREAVEQLLVREPVVRALVVRGYAPLVAPPERRAAPVV